ncbi:protein of unknown function [Arachidicoccus rhizosphaerae]|uniref:Beta-galactosidase n=1 Tax=Arachidicoccus rhizosphaerae TaxID=551991 RepID=A0A1H3Y934_9BACT|nr:glycoside hydrolase family 2 TIM barrel-domain containing protein [Arachidicoccus rhizosphaerae]SEA07398.1 protein of unknown function [Arachidicoccus rhizosphaerae]
MQNFYKWRMVIGLVCFFLIMKATQAQLPSSATLFNKDWTFYKGDIFNIDSLDELPDSAWKSVSLPHDWSIQAGFSPSWASATGYLPGGVGWYKKRFMLNHGETGLLQYIYFGGIYKNSKVWLNGHELGERPNGFSSFFYNMTPYLRANGQNELLVFVDHSKYADSRWYTGSGMNRNVYLLSLPQVHIPIWGVAASTQMDNKMKAQVRLQITVQNQTKQLNTVVIENKLVDGNGAAVAFSKQMVALASGENIIVDTSLLVSKPALWSVDHPYLYTLETTLKSKGKLTEVFKTPLGIRHLRFTADSGLFLNGENIKLKGVCIHDDAGCFGTAVPMGVWQERLALLKAAGCNAIRMSHNPHAKALYDLCDRMGFLVIDEAFDEWELGKHKWITGWNNGVPGTDGYHEDFKQWWQKDLGDMIRRDQNHPSVIMWSIGNEIDYPNDPYSDKILNEGHYPQIYGSGFMGDHPDAARLGRISHELALFTRSMDSTRPVTAALAAVMMSDKAGYTGNLDIAGYNYQEYRYEKDHKEFPNRIIYGSENGHGYDGWQAVANHSYIMGQFLWTGIDYLGEANKWPGHGNEAGLIDLADFKKPEYYFRASLWSANPMIYIGTSKPYRHLNLRKGRHGMAQKNWNYQKGDSVNVYCYTNCSKATLLLNDTSLGTKCQNDSTHVIMWRIAYQPGKLLVKGVQNGKTVTDEIHTYDREDHIQASCHELAGLPEEKKIYAIDMQVVDKSGYDVPTDSIRMMVKVRGGGQLLGLENGNIADSETYGGNSRRVFNGRLRAYVEQDAPTRVIQIVISSAENQKVSLKPTKFEIKP